MKIGYHTRDLVTKVWHWPGNCEENTAPDNPGRRQERASPDRAKGLTEIGSPEVSNSVRKDLHGYDDSEASVHSAIQGSAGLLGW
jgi:hypothetical protein